MSKTPRLFLLLTICALLVPSVAASADASWATYRGPANSGVAAEGLPPGDGPLGLWIGWKKPLGSGYSGISLAEGRAVTAFTDGEKDLLVAFEAATGDEIWRREIGAHYPGNDGAHAGPVATPAIADGRVFMLDPAGSFGAYKLSDGSELWTTDLVADHGSEKPTYGFGGSPLVVGDLVVLQIGGEGGSTAAFDVASGELRWRAVEDKIFSQSPVLAEVGGRQQLLVLTNKKFSGLDPASGEVLWELVHEGGGGAMGALTSGPVPLGDDRIFVKIDDPDARVIEVIETDGKFEAKKGASAKAMVRSYSPVVANGDHVYGYTARFLSAVDPESGEMLWRTRAVGDGFVISVGDHLAIIQKTGSLHLGAASPDGWNEAASLELFDEHAWAPPSYLDGSIYVRSHGEIARVDVVRRPTSVMADVELPKALAGLAKTVVGSDHASRVVDFFLADRELPIVDGNEVTFLWRGEADDVAVAGDMIGMRREEKMHRLEGTDLWWWSTETDPRARFNYLFYPDYEPALDPSHDRVVRSTLLGPDMNFNRGEELELSWVAMPEWPGNSVAAAAPESVGRLHEVELTLQPSANEGEETPEAIQAPTQVWLPPGYDAGDDRYPVVYVINGEAREVGNWQATLDSSVGRTVEPLIVVFLELPRAPGLQGALAGQVVPQIDEVLRTRPERDARGIVGMGFPAFNTLLTGFGSPDTFGALGMQSFFFLEGGMRQGILGAVGEKTAAETPMRIYLEWGRWDLRSPHEGYDFRDASKWVFELLTDKGYAPIGGEVWDSTDHSSWSNRTGVMLNALFPVEGAKSDLEIWQTGAP